VCVSLPLSVLSMLGRLDDQMDKQDYAVHSQMPKQLVSVSDPYHHHHHHHPPSSSSSSSISSTQPISSTPLPSLPPLLTSNTTIGARPLLSASHPRVPLSSLVSDLVNQWSLAFLDLANEGDSSAMLLVAQMFLIPKGYGRIHCDRQAGVKWLMRAVENDEPEARELAKKLCPEEYTAFINERKRITHNNKTEEHTDRTDVDMAPAERKQRADNHHRQRHSQR